MGTRRGFNQSCAALIQGEAGVWSGKLHFPLSGGRDSWVSVYLAVNPKAGERKQPQLYIRDSVGRVTIGYLHRLESGQYRGQLDTSTPLLLTAFFDDRAADGVRRFVIRHVAGAGIKPRYPIILNLLTD